MKKKLLFVILILVALILYSNIAHNKKIKTDNYRIEELRKHYTALVGISENLKWYDSSINGDGEFYLRGLLRTSRDFEIAINSYKNALDKEKNENNGRDVPDIIDNYFDLFIEAAVSIDEIDYEILGAIKDDFLKWYMWIDNTYVYTDKNGHLIHKIYTVDDMIESKLLDEFKLIDLEQLNKRVFPN